MQGAWLILAAGVLWGTTGTAQALAPAGATPAAIGALRLVVGGAALLVAAAKHGRFGNLRRWPIFPTLLAAAGVAAYQLLFFAGVAATGVAIGTMVAIGSAPVFAGALAFFVRGERPAARWYLATALAVGGAVLLSRPGSGLDANFAGILLALGAGAAYAGYAVSSKGLLDDLEPDATMAAVFCLAAVLLAPVLWTSDLAWAATAQGAAVILHLGLIATAAAYLLFARGLAMTPVSSAVTLSLAEPLTAALLGITLLGERPDPVEVAGILLLAAGLVVLAGAERPQASSRR